MRAARPWRIEGRVVVSTGTSADAVKKSAACSCADRRDSTLLRVASSVATLVAEKSGTRGGRVFEGGFEQRAKRFPVGRSFRLALNLAIEPRSRQRPVAFHRDWRDAKNGRGLCRQ